MHVKKLLPYVVFAVQVFVGGCTPGDDVQVQVAETDAGFADFRHAPPDIVYGPYALAVTTDSAVIAWEERRGLNGLRHVEVEMGGLEPGIEYRYRVNGAAGDGRFVTPPDTDNGSSFGFFVWGDTRTGNNESGRIVDAMLARDPEAAFALHTGDMVEDGDVLDDWEVHWWTPMADLLAAMPVYPTMGNHEVNSEWYQRYFGCLGDRGMNYSFDWGRVHFVVLDANSVNFGTEQQLAWLEADLREHMDADFTIVGHHIPVYFSSPGDTNGMPYLQESVLPLYERYGVDLVLSGDVHSYQHHVRNGIHFLISAGGGEKPSEHGLPLEGMTRALAQVYHYVHCRVDGKTMQVTAYDVDGAILEAFSIEAGAPSALPARVVVEADREQAAPGDTIVLDISVENISGLERAALSLPYVKSRPPVALTVADSDPSREGIQVLPGGLGGSVTGNSADNATGVLQYTEEDIGGGSLDTGLIASVELLVPDDVRATAFYFVPVCTFQDSTGNTIPHSMGGVKVVLKL